MSLDISHETEARITDEAQPQSVTVETVDSSGSVPQLARLHLGVKGELHRREIYDDAR